MAVEAPHMTLFPPQILPNREMIDQGNGIRYDNGVQTAYGMAPLPGTKTEKLLPMHGSRMADSLPPAALKADSGLTCSPPPSRKRSRDSSSFNPSLSVPNAPLVNQSQLNRHQLGTFTFLGEDISMQFYQQQLEINRFLAHHTQKVRTEMEGMRKRNSRRLIAATEEGIMKRLRAKEEEVLKIGKLNWSLEEKVKSLSVENQIWRELAQTNEATANALRNNLQQVLAQVQLQQQQQHRLDFADNAATATALIDDAQSYCGSNYEEDQLRQQRTLAEEGGGERKMNNANRNNDEDEYCTTTSTSGGSNRYGRLNRCCRNCGKEESCVLLLPCRHLCVCTVCASSISICPVCKSRKSAGVPINMS